MYITIEEIKLFLGITEDENENDNNSLLEKHIVKAEMKITAEVGELLEIEVSEFINLKKGRSMYYLKNGNAKGEEVISAKAFFQNKEIGDFPSVIYLNSNCIKLSVKPIRDRMKGLKITYISGFFTKENVPEDLKYLIYEMIEINYKKEIAKIEEEEKRIALEEAGESQAEIKSIKEKIGEYSSETVYNVITKKEAVESEKENLNSYDLPITFFDVLKKYKNNESFRIY